MTIANLKMQIDGAARRRQFAFFNLQWSFCNRILPPPESLALGMPTRMIY
jgi:hypothetical protein